MEQDNPDVVVQRIAHLEKSLTQVSWGLAALGIVTASLIGFIAVLLIQGRSVPPKASAVQGRISAKEFVVTDETGKAIGWFGGLGLIVGSTESARKLAIPSDIEKLADTAEKRGGLALIVDDQEATLDLNATPSQKTKASEISLSSDREGASIYLFGDERSSAFLGVHDFPKIGNSPPIPEFAELELSQPIPTLGQAKTQKSPRQMSIDLDADGSSHLEFAEGLLKYAGFGVDTHGVPELSLFDGDGKERGSFNLGEDGEPKIFLRAGGEKNYAGIAFDDKGLMSIDETDKVRAYVGNDGFQLQDAKGTTRAVLGSVGLQTVRTGAIETTAVGTLTLFDKDGKVIWQVPR